MTLMIICCCAGLLAAPFVDEPTPTPPTTTPSPTSSTVSVESLEVVDYKLVIVDNGGVGTFKRVEGTIKNETASSKKYQIFFKAFDKDGKQLKNCSDFKSRGISVGEVDEFSAYCENDETVRVGKPQIKLD